MGFLSLKRLSVATIFLLLTGFVAHFRPNSPSQDDSMFLAAKFAEIGAWRAISDIPLESKIQRELELDDYLYRSFSNGRATIFLYIGYYHAAAKVGASHDPLVCFPGQGWVLRDLGPNVNSMQIFGIDQQLSYKTMVAERDGHKQLLLYWFQADSHMTSNTLMQKIHLVKSRLSGRGQQHNAFVRLSMDLNGVTVEDGRQAMVNFVTNFYPLFVEYVSVASGLRRE